ncbi:MAG TPA: peptide-methionine (R)-S-oxide reductase MsrB, partial [Bacillota bacterium]|nr:peptide-methionine (R)-S-oxide reductase MsrB [Bacillota bacterium]
TYEEVTTNTTGHQEAVQITFDPEIISYKEIVQTFWQQIDPTDPGGQFHDRGDSYKTAIFYHNDHQKEVAEHSKEEVEKSGRFQDPIATQIIQASEFYPAEEEHQDFYKKNKAHYERYSVGSGRKDFIKQHWSQKESKTDLRKRLTPIQFAVTQEDATERPFDNAYWDNEEEGIYVDIISGEVLFSSQDKFDAQCGWPSFTKPVDENALTEKDDFKLARVRTEVRTKNSDSHLGHVFDDGPVEQGGLRYCMNSAALQFIPKEKMAEEGYEKYFYLFDK